MDRRTFIIGAISTGFAFILNPLELANAMDTIEKIVKSDEQWKKILTDNQFYILRQEGTERAFTSALNDEKRNGVFTCAGCDLALFTSEMKYDSGTGWPSFYDTIPGRIGTKTDYKLLIPRTEYHCIRCEGHQGHVFSDGPSPIGKRYCNNGLALIFVPTKDVGA